MARWILLGLAVLGFGLAFAARTPGLLGLGLLLGLIGMVGFVFAIAAARVSAAARPETMMASIEEHSLLRRPGAPPRPAAGPVVRTAHVTSGSDSAPADHASQRAAPTGGNGN